MSIQQTIIKGIKEQLFFNDYLVLPNFGGFVLKSKPAHFSVSGGLLVPPSKTVSFNAQLKQNDGILTLWLQNALNCNAGEAITHLNDFSEFCTGILNAKRRLSLEGIGFFYLDFENNVCFEPQQDSNFLAASFGLGPLTIKELEPAVSELKKEKETVFVDRTLRSAEQPLPPVRNRRNYSRMVTPLLVSILFVSLLGLLVNNTTIKGELHSSIFGSSSRSTYNPVNYPELAILGSPAKLPAYVADANGIASLELAETKKVAVTVLNHQLNSSTLNASSSVHLNTSNTHDFEIVLGCFSIRENANRMIQKLSSQNIKAIVSGKNEKGMFVVSNGNYATKEEAINKLQEVKETFPHAWIKKGN